MFSKLILTTFFYFLKTSYSATASFSKSNSGVDGQVIVDTHSISVSLDLSSIDYTKIPGGVTCFEDGITYHLHEKWTYADNKDRVGASACGDTYTGGHYDPYLACGSKTGNGYCEVLGGCVTSSSALHDNDVYSCNSSIYEENPYTCEVGDWSGKYGTLYADSSNITTGLGISFWEVNPEDVEGRSVVFHCANSGQRAFCAPFNTTTDFTNMNVTQTTSDISLGAILDYYDGFPLSFFMAFPNGKYIGAFNLNNFGNLSCDTLNYRIYNQWTDNHNITLKGNDTCHAVVGQVWDPTVSCLNGSDSSFCDSEYHLCGVSNYSYSCDSTDRYSCSPSDLSGKYGVLTTSNPLVSLDGTDELLPPFNLIEGKAIVLECAYSNEIIACGKIGNYISLFNETFETTEPSSTLNETLTTTEATTISTIEAAVSTTEEASNTTEGTTYTTGATASTTGVTTTKQNKSQGCSYNINILLIFGTMGLIWWQSN